MEQLKAEMIAEAKTKASEKYGADEIYPINTKSCFDECFTEEDGLLIFWFDIELDCGRTSGIIKREIDN